MKVLVLGAVVTTTTVCFSPRTAMRWRSSIVDSSPFGCSQMIDALDWFPETGIFHAGRGGPRKQTLGREGHLLARADAVIE